MNIAVCIKQVPDAKDVRLDPKTNTMSREGVASIMNPFDRHALEEAVRIREQNGGKVVAISMGPPQAAETLREAIACGADEAVLVSDRAFAGADTWATTYTLAKAIGAVGVFDLILCGKHRWRYRPGRSRSCRAIAYPLRFFGTKNLRWRRKCFPSRADDG